MSYEEISDNDMNRLCGDSDIIVKIVCQTSGMPVL